ncbi:PREDICTED: uncharacterized protein LOC104810738 [Tarenaya hassleriana]|uniref:uncharacterized protein LOC104810738 n=1 Tax=Tarenaya hassleriana TaxID=28532 RepID=UPI00053C6309|nr:PREDICTED: uncharacterized protein LOC104810738 [Tarenaya hassleriana]
MAKFNCFAGLMRKKNKANGRTPRSGEYKSSQRIRQLRLEEPVKPLENDEPNSSGHDKAILGNHTPVGPASYDGEDERDDENASMKREFSDFHPQASAPQSTNGDFCSKDSNLENVKEVSEAPDGSHGYDGHVSDPGVGRVASMEASPKLKRSCSSLETREVLSKITSRLTRPDHVSPRDATEFFDIAPESPTSVLSQRSADRVMLKKYSSRQILPSRSKRLWWKLFLWSHRNLHKRQDSSKSQPLRVSEAKQESGYASDILEHNQVAAKSSPGAFTEDSPNNFTGSPGQEASSSLWPHNQWLAFSAESSSFKRVDEWVRDLDVETSVPAFEDGDIAGGFDFPNSLEAERSNPGGQMAHNGSSNIYEAIVHANSLIQSLNKSSSVAHISSIGLKAVPTICHFNSLKSVDLSNNFIVQITQGSLPKGLHALDLSKNKITVIEGLRDLSRLRVLDLSYNRISRIGQGLSNCVLIKELYLAGNKISNVEGLHRLLKLTVLDLSFNKITTAKSIGQLVANYNSLVALNLLGNPIQSNIGEDQLRKAACGLLPKLVYLNKQSVKPHRAREVITDSVARAALGGGSNGSSSLHRHRRSGKRVSGSGGSSSSPSVHKHKGTKNRSRHQLKKTALH